MKQILMEDITRLRDAEIPTLQLLTEMGKEGVYLVRHQERIYEIIKHFESLKRDLQNGTH